MILSMKSEAIFLIGFMGAGKTHVGQLLAKCLSTSFHDVDSQIEARMGMPIHELVAQRSQAHFRDYERQWLADFGGSGVVACGGGFVCYNNLMEPLKARGRVIYLKASAKTLWDRVAKMNTQHRILLCDFESFAQLLESREAIYESAHAVVNTDGRELDDVVLQCCEYL